MRFLQDKVEIFGKSLDPINEVGEMTSLVYQVNLISRIGQKYLNTLVTQVPNKCDHIAPLSKYGGRGCICYCDALMELVESKIAIVGLGDATRIQTNGPLYEGSSFGKFNDIPKPHCDDLYSRHRPAIAAIFGRSKALKTFQGGIEVNKYYFITYITRELGKEYLESDVIDEHPFNWLMKAQSEINHKIVLAGWQEISEEEYHIYDYDRMESNPILPRETAADLNRLEELRQSDQKGLES